MLEIVKVGALFLLYAANTFAANTTIQIAGHRAQFDGTGHLLPWMAIADLIDREMHFYASAPSDHGYPIFVTTTFLDGNWTPLPARDDTIPATQNGMGILSYLAYYEWRGRNDQKTLTIAASMGDYLVTEDSTPNDGAYPRFTRSTGRRQDFPQRADSGSQSDRPYEIEPDKGAIAGYALMRLYAQTQNRAYFDQALHNARVLASHQRSGDATHSPWPFRVDYRTAAARGEVSGDTVFPLRLYDSLIDAGYPEFAKPRRALWSWILRYQIPSARKDGKLFAQFFEDHDNPANRTAWTPINLARYLLERRERVDAAWRTHSAVLIDFVRRNFTHFEAGIVVCHEQDEDHDAWGGINSTYAAVLALYAKATHDDALAQQAGDALTFTSYSIEESGASRDMAKNPSLGGWQEDAHTDVVHNMIEALQALQ